MTWQRCKWNAIRVTDARNDSDHGRRDRNFILKMRKLNASAQPAIVECVLHFMNLDA